jgi:hypothetical protein
MKGDSEMRKSNVEVEASENEISACNHLDHNCPVRDKMWVEKNNPSNNPVP